MALKPHQAVRVGKEALRRGDARLAVQIAHDLVKVGYVMPDLIGLLSLLGARPATRPAGINLLEVCIRERPQLADGPFALARLLERQNPARSIALYEEAVRRRPAFDEAHDLLQALRLTIRQPHLDAPVSVILPTTGHPFVRTALQSVLAQEHPAVDVMLVADGPEARGRLDEVVGDLLSDPRVALFSLPYNVGAGLFNGHRAYASMPALARGRFVAFLDQDNAWAPDHLSRLVALVATERLQWATSLRTLVDADGRVVMPDDAENVQPWPAPDGKHMNDTSAYLLRTDIAVRSAHVWYARYRDLESPDILLCRHLRAAFPRTGTTGAYTLFYRLGRSDSVPLDYFERNAAKQREAHGAVPPWRKVPPPAPSTLMPGMSR